MLSNSISTSDPAVNKALPEDFA